MATLALCGFGGSVTGLTSVLNVREWEVTQTVDTPDATSMDSNGWVEWVACLKGASGTFRSFAKGVIGADASAVFKDKTGGYTISGAVIIQTIVTETPVDDLVSYTHTFVFTGSFTAA